VVSAAGRHHLHHAAAVLAAAGRRQAVRSVVVVQALAAGTNTHPVYASRKEGLRNNFRRLSAAGEERADKRSDVGVS